MSALPAVCAAQLSRLSGCCSATQVPSPATGVAPHVSQVVLDILPLAATIRPVSMFSAHVSAIFGSAAPNCGFIAQACDAASQTLLVCPPPYSRPTSRNPSLLHRGSSPSRSAGIPLPTTRPSWPAAGSHMGSRAPCGLAAGIASTDCWDSRGYHDQTAAHCGCGSIKNSAAPGKV